MDENRMEKTILSIGRFSVSAFSPVPFRECSGMIYTHMTHEDAEAVAKLQSDAKYVLVSIDGADWNNDLSPWPAPKAFRNGDAFGGGADRYLQELTKIIVPAVEAKIGTAPDFRAIAGYSLAGLFAIYALYRTDLFGRAASMSGSLWYDGFLDFMIKNRPLRTPQKVYFSLGDRESSMSNRRFARVGDCTIQAEDLLRSRETSTEFEWNKGSHFVDVPERIAKGMRWIASEPIGDRSI